MDLYAGIVVNNKDPDKVGKIQIRVPIIHGNGKSGYFIEDKNLPWYEPCIPWYAGYHSGSFMVPPEGSILWCIEQKIESGNTYRVYLGGSYGIGPKNPKKFGGKSVPLGQLETPPEALDGYPQPLIVIKSLSGSVIYIDKNGNIIMNYGGSTAVMTPGKVDIVTGEAAIHAGNITLDGETFITKNLTVAGDATIGGISFLGHTHTGVHGETTPPH